MSRAKLRGAVSKVGVDGLAADAEGLREVGFRFPARGAGDEVVDLGVGERFFTTLVGAALLGFGDAFGLAGGSERARIQRTRPSPTAAGSPWARLRR